MIVNSKVIISLSLLFVAALALPAPAAEQKSQPTASAKKEAVKPVSEPHKAAGGTKDKKGTKKDNKPVKTKLKIDKIDTVITVGDMHCKHCAKKIASKLYTVKGVMKVRTDVKADVAIVTPQKKKQLSTKALWAASQKAGFQPVLLEGPTGKFEADPKTKAPKLIPAKPAKVAKKPKQQPAPQKAPAPGS